ncbi:MAG: hypothetical protein HFG33_02800 [Bacilli bacterium]|nr:hypothetical protein [Bacilli bacterium]
MKGLLHSKRFRTNLYKWLFMYVGVMALLTTVITYSKYISTFMSGDEANTTRFEMKVTPQGCTGSICNLGSHRPTSDIAYDFDVEEEFEVNTYLILSFITEENFKIKKIEAVEFVDENVDEEKFTPIYTVSSDGTVTFGSGYENAKKSKTENVQLGRKVVAATKRKTRYRVTLEHKIDEYLTTDENGNIYYDYTGTSTDNTINKEVVQLGYSAMQITN